MRAWEKGGSIDTMSVDCTNHRATRVLGRSGLNASYWWFEIGEYCQASWIT